VFLLCLSLFLLLQLYSFFTATDEPLINLFDDDAYYYFKIARNFAQNGRLTFDGQTLTNGFQPLWLLVLLPFFRFIDDPILVLRVVGVFSVFLCGLAGYLSLRHLSRYSLLPFAVGGAFSLYCLFSLGVTGMETTLVLPLMMVSLLLVGKLANGQTTVGWGLAAGVSLALLLLARLDTIWLVASLLAGSLFFHRKNMKAHLVAASLPALILVLYLTINLIVFGHPMPVSGLAKSLGEQGLHFNQLFFSQLTHRGDPATGNLWVSFGASCLFSGVYIPASIHALIKKDNLTTMSKSLVPLGVASAFLLFTAYELFVSTWVHWRWHAYLLFPMGTFLLPYVLERIERRLAEKGIFTRSIQIASLVLAVLAGVQIAITAIRAGWWSQTQAPAFRYDNQQLAELLNETMPPTTILGMGDRAGSLGYFFHGSVLQLEGLVGDRAMLEAIGTNSLMEYMTRFGVDYVVNHMCPPNEDYVQWRLETPLPGFSTGFHAEILLCRETEALQFKTPYQVITLWQWPSCGE